MDDKINSKNANNTKLKYIKINKKNKIEVFEEMEYNNEKKKFN